MMMTLKKKFREEKENGENMGMDMGIGDGMMDEMIYTRRGFEFFFPPYFFYFLLFPLMMTNDALGVMLAFDVCWEEKKIYILTT